LVFLTRKIGSDEKLTASGGALGDMDEMARDAEIVGVSEDRAGN